MIDRLAREGRAVYVLLAAYFGLNLILRVLGPASLELDEGQQLFLAQWLSIGYDSQPPLYNWLQYGVVQLFGSSVLSLALLKNLMLFGSYLFYGLTAAMLVKDRLLAVVATLGMIIIPQISFEAQRDLTHTVAVLFSACLFLYFFIRTLQRPSTLNYALTGLAIGLGTLSKYNFVLLPAAAAIAALANPAFRARVLDTRILLTGLIAAVLVAPHAVWFFDHLTEATRNTLGKLDEEQGNWLGTTAAGLVSLGSALAVTILPTVAVFWIAFRGQLADAWRTGNAWTRLIEHMMIALVAFLLLLVLFGADNIKGRWLVPYFFLLPLYLALKLDAVAAPDEIDRKPPAQRFLFIVIAAMAAILIVLYGRSPMASFLGTYTKQNVPYGPAVTAILATNPDRPAFVVALDQQLAGNVRLHAPALSVMVPNAAQPGAAVALDADRPMLVIWRARDGRPSDLPAQLADWVKADADLRNAKVDPRDIALPYHFGREGDRYHFGYAWIYPTPR